MGGGLRGAGLGGELRSQSQSHPAHASFFPSLSLGYTVFPCCNTESFHSIEMQNKIAERERKREMSWGGYSAARNNNDGGSENVIVVQITGDVEIAVLGVAVAEETGLARGFEALSEGKVVVAIPAPKRRHVAPPVELLHSFVDNNQF